MGNILAIKLGGTAVSPRWGKRETMPLKKKHLEDTVTLDNAPQKLKSCEKKFLIDQLIPNRAAGGLCTFLAVTTELTRKNSWSGSSRQFGNLHAKECRKVK